MTMIDQHVLQDYIHPSGKRSLSKHLMTLSWMLPHPSLFIWVIRRGQTSHYQRVSSSMANGWVLPMMRKSIPCLISLSLSRAFQSLKCHLNTLLNFFIMCVSNDFDGRPNLLQFCLQLLRLLLLYVLLHIGLQISTNGKGRKQWVKVRTKEWNDRINSIIIRNAPATFSRISEPKKEQGERERAILLTSSPAPRS